MTKTNLSKELHLFEIMYFAKFTESIDLPFSTMKSFLDKLPENQFIRIHKSYIVNLKKVINYTARNVNTDGEVLPLSRKQKEVFKENFINFQ